MTTTTNPDFEVLGHFEEFHDIETGRCLGTRDIPDPGDRPLGAAGRREFTLAQPIELGRGPKVFTIPAGRRVATMIQQTCGRAKWVHPLDRERNMVL